MFTGIVQAVGRIATVESAGATARVFARTISTACLRDSTLSKRTSSVHVDPSRM